MSRIQQIVLVLSLVITGLLAWYVMARPTQVVQQDTAATRALQAMIYQCDDITERAAAHLVAVVEFQRLEIIGRKARVFKLCMQDRGYQENTAWLLHALPVAKTVSKAQQISIDEAVENLRRADMKVSAGEQSRPTFWVKNQPA